MPFNRQGWVHILEKHKGVLPLRIEAVREGCVLPIKNVVVQVENTDPEVPWLTSYIETALLRAVWYPTTVATLSWHVKQIIGKYLQETCEKPQAELPFKLHDFGARGSTSYEAASIGGLAHLVNFQGTDTVSALLEGRNYYNVDMAGFSIPASEHSTMTAWGRSRETEAYDNMIKQFGGEDRVFAVVSDSYDLFSAVKNIWGGHLKNKVMENGGTLVVRPDSGNPIKVCVDVVESLDDIFGYKINLRGYKVLPPYVRVIQGDGVHALSIEAILQRLKKRGWSAENIAFGMGGALLQRDIHRDIMNWAMKANAIKFTDESNWREVYKDPITDPGKKSKRGRQALVKDIGIYKTIRRTELGNRENQLQEVWRNGQLVRDQTFDEIRKLSRS